MGSESTVVSVAPYGVRGMHVACGARASILSADRSGSWDWAVVSETVRSGRNFSDEADCGSALAGPDGAEPLFAESSMPL
jgi:hypothetical protein